MSRRKKVVLKSSMKDSGAPSVTIALGVGQQPSSASNSDTRKSTSVRYDSFQSVIFNMKTLRMDCCSYGTVDPCCAAHGEGQGVIWLDDVNCDGDESGLDTCRRLNWGHSRCRHSEDVSVTCCKRYTVFSFDTLPNRNIARFEFFQVV